MTRYAAPAALLFVVTVAVLALHYTVQRPAHAVPAVTATVPKVKHVKRAAAITRTYVVLRGDSFSSIAVKTHTTVARLERLNPGVSTTALRVGEQITVK